MGARTLQRRGPEAAGEPAPACAAGSPASPGRDAKRAYRAAGRIKCHGVAQSCVVGLSVVSGGDKERRSAGANGHM